MDGMDDGVINLIDTRSSPCEGEETCVSQESNSHCYLTLCVITKSTGAMVTSCVRLKSNRILIPYGSTGSTSERWLEFISIRSFSLVIKQYNRGCLRSRDEYLEESWGKTSLGI
jgi:hypothetical protein